MTADEVIEYFGGAYEVARAVGVKGPSVYTWRDIKGGIPWDRQLQIERLTKGALKHDPAKIPEHMRGYILMRRSRRVSQ
jgi:DNA-binding transcriptional regulator YdaS (Cro superfamily)